MTSETQKLKLVFSFQNWLKFPSSPPIWWKSTCV